MYFVLQRVMVLSPIIYLFRSKLTKPVEGEEVYMSYGPHPNDFLLAECKHQSV